MFRPDHWLSVYWLALVPLASIAGALLLARTFRAARRRSLVDARAYLWLLAAIAASQALVGLLLASGVYETCLWLPAGALFAVLMMGVASSRASGSVHPGLRGFLRPLPRDGIELIGRSAPGAQRWRTLRVVARKALLLVPCAALAVYSLAHLPGRWPGLWLVVPALFAPLTIVPSRRLSLPLLLLPLPLVSGLHALELRGALPPGRWSTPLTAATCTNSVQLDLARTSAWCADDVHGLVFQFDPHTGIVREELRVVDAGRVFAVGSDHAWVVENPVRGLLRVQAGRLLRQRIDYPRQGVVDAEDRLWFIGVSSVLGVVEPGALVTWFDTSDGLLSNTANVVKAMPDGSIWVGSVGGVSFKPGGSERWVRLGRAEGVPGQVHDIAVSADGTAWFLWNDFTSHRGTGVWGVSQWRAGNWQHFELGAPTGLDAPASPDALAIDGYGRVWFTAVSYRQQANFLGILDPRALQVTLYPLGPFVPTRDPLVFVPGPHGVLDDGQGGIYLYNPSRDPLRWWRGEGG